jgi:hypothetical protein
VKRRVVATVEVMVVFLLCVLLFHAIRAVPFSQWEVEILPGQQLFLLEYGATLVALLVLLALTRRDWAEYGLTLKNLREQMRVVAVGLLPVLTLGATLGRVNWRTWQGAAIVSLVALAGLVVTGWALRKRGAAPVTLALLIGLALPALATSAGPVGAAIVKTAYVYLLVGPAEELLFRGYVQSRLNAAYGRPYQFFGVKWGWGVVVAAAFFALWHAVWRPLAAEAWLHGLWTFFAGLLFGYVRERGRSVAPASILHSAMNYLPFFDLLGA